MNLRRSRFMNLQRFGILNLWSSAIRNLRNRVSRALKFGSYGWRIRRSKESQVKVVTSKSPGLACELVAGL
jgi:hypothetical protein